MKNTLRYALLFCAVLLLAACASVNKSPNAVQDTHTALGTLPATFQGELPCADCAGIHYELNLYPDHVYTLQTNYAGNNAQAPAQFEMGDWRIRGHGHELELVPQDGEQNTRWRIADADTLIMLDAEGNEATSGLNYKLRRTGRPESASLEDTYWRLTRLQDKPVTDQMIRVPHLVLDADSDRISGATGCNLLLGQYSHDATHLRFTKLGSTRMACPGPSMSTETAMTHALGETSRYRILEDHLILYNDQGAPLALFHAIDVD